MLSNALFITELSDWGRRAFSSLQRHVHGLDAVFWQRGDPQPNVLDEWTGNWILSFKSDLVLPQHLLDRAEKGSINFHPSPPEYRGIGGHYWAIANQDEQFGVTCHHMIRRVDLGPIIEVRRFPMLPRDTPSSLKERADANCLTLFFDTVSSIALNEPLAVSTATWRPHLYTHKELDDLLSNTPFDECK